MVLHSVRNITGTTHGDEAAYECLEGYNMIGDGRVTCGIHGYWSLPPSCQGKRQIMQINAIVLNQQRLLRPLNTTTELYS